MKLRLPKNLDGNVSYLNISNFLKVTTAGSNIFEGEMKQHIQTKAPDDTCSP
jgi:hypothetical protein